MSSSTHPNRNMHISLGTLSYASDSSSSASPSPASSPEEPASATSVHIVRSSSPSGATGRPNLGRGPQFDFGSHTQLASFFSFPAKPKTSSPLSSTAPSPEVAAPQPLTPMPSNEPFNFEKVSLATKRKRDLMAITEDEGDEE